MLHADKQEVWQEYQIKMVDSLNKYDGIVLAVAHNEFLSLNLGSFKSSSRAVIYDLKAVLNRQEVDARL